MSYLDGLNERQEEAVVTTDGPVMVLAGAGSGKTRVLTSRIYHLIRNGVEPGKILAVTFTNKASREMRERLGRMLEPEGRGRTSVNTYWRTDLPLVSTFHGLGRRILEEYGSRLGLPRHFCVYDRDDSKKLIREILKDMGIDPKELAPGAALSIISKAKGEGTSAEAFGEREQARSFRARMVSLIWPRYDARLRAEKALDFDDLIMLPVKLLEEHEDIRNALQERFTHMHVDEYQDTNELQGKLTNLLVQKHNNLFVVGDIDQCLVAGTQITMADSSQKYIETIQEGDMVLSNHGSGDLRPARVASVNTKSYTGDLIRITTKAGRELTSTPEHLHFAGYRLGLTPQLHFTYLMHKRDKGWRLGVSQTYTNGLRKPMVGFQQRCNQEHGDAVWIVGTHENSSAARVHEYLLSLTYGIPTLPFVARKGSIGGYVHNQDTLDKIFTSLATDAAAERLLADKNVSRAYPHHRAQATHGRRNIVVTLCGDRRGSTPMHRVAIAGSNKVDRDALQRAGFSVRQARLGSTSWRFESAHADFGMLRDRVNQLLSMFPDAQVVECARLGGKKKNQKDGNSLSFLPATSVQPGMTVFDEETGYDIVEKIERVPVEEIAVFDLNIERTHNFIANGIHTHNCIYTWRGATIGNLLSFEETYPGAKTIVLEHNYRSTKTIVEAANQIIEKNRNRKEKRSVTDNPEGEAITVAMLSTGEEEAAFVARETARICAAGVHPEDVAVLFRANFQSRLLEEAFLHARIPYRLLGTRFFERREVKDVIAWVRLSLDPTREADRVRAVQAPSRGIGKVTLGKIAAGRTAELRAGERTKFEAFSRIVDALAESAKTETPSGFIRLVIERSGIGESLKKEGEEGQERLENIKELATIATRYDATPGIEGLAAFLADAALASDQDELDQGEKRAVTLMTVHAAKGLEFDTVFVTGLEEGLFPHDAINESEERDEEEERRLFYVAVTRAKRRLVLTLAQVRRIYGTDYLSAPSSFLSDIDSSLITHTTAYHEQEEIIEA